jgi:ATP-binding cassette subfamily B protein
MSKTKAKKPKIIANNLYILKLSWKISPKRVIADFIFNLIYYFSMVFFSVIFIKYLLVAIQAEKSFGSLVLFIIGTVIVIGASQFFNEWYNNRLEPITYNMINSRLNKMLFEKASEMELACYEDTEFYNTYTLAMKEADTRVTSLLQDLLY